MRFHWFDRLLMVILFLLVLAGSVVAIGVFWDFFSIQVIMDLLLNDPIWLGGVTLALALMVIISLRILVAGFKKPSRPIYAVSKVTEYGTVCVTVDSINQMIGRYVRSTGGIIDVKNSVQLVENGIKILLRLSVANDIVLPEKCAQLQKDLKTYLEYTTGLAVQQISVMVDNTQSKSQNSMVEA